MKNKLYKHLTYLSMLSCAMLSVSNANALPQSRLTGTNSSAATANYNSIAYGKDAYIVVGDAGTVLASVDGINWDSIDTGLSVNLNSVIFDSDYNMFYAVGDAGTVITSPNGTTWSNSNLLSTTLNLHSVTSGEGYILIAADSGTVFELNPGQNIVKSITNSVIAAAGENLISSAYGHGMFIVGGNQGSILYNPASTWNSPTWNRATKFPDVSVNGLNFDNNNALFLAVGSSGYTMHSSVGWTSWSTPLSITSSNLFAIAVNSSALFTAVGGGSGNSAILSSSNLYNWNADSTNFSNTLNDVECFNQSCYSVGDNGTILSSINSLPWSISGGIVAATKEPLQTKYKGTSKAVQPSLMTMKCTVNMQLNLTDGPAVYVHFNGAEQPQCENNTSCTINSSTNFTYNWQTQSNPSKNLVLEIDDRKYDITAYCNN